MKQPMLPRYETAQAIMQGYLTNQLVRNDAVFPHWAADADEAGHCFWYMKETQAGREFRLVDAQAATNELAFDHEALATALAKVSGTAATATDLPIRNVSLTLSKDGATKEVGFEFKERCWRFDPTSKQLNDAGAPAQEEASVLSADGKMAVFVKEHNLWVRDLESGSERALTEDGTQDYGYGESFLKIDPSVQARWSPDSARIFAIRLDMRQVAARPILSYVPPDGGLDPRMHQLKMPPSGSEHIPTNQVVVIDVADGACRTADYPAIPFFLHGPETIDGFFTGNLGWWSNDNRHAYFVDVARGSKTVRVVRWDTQTDVTSILFEETSATRVQLCVDSASAPVFLPLPETDELIWFSERTGWAHLYLYDLKSGKVKRPLTAGDWQVRGVLHYDAAKRELLVQTAGRDPKVSPYYADICKVDLDSGTVTPVLTGNFEHIVPSPKQGFSVVNRATFKIDSAADVSGVSPNGKFLVVTRSRVDTPPVTLLVERNGREVLTVETTDTSSLPADWVWPEPVTLKADDGVTNLYGVVFRPPGFSKDKRYPVVDFVGGMRYTNLVPTGSFVNTYFLNYFDMAALAALGFIVVGILGRGTPLRDKGFQDHGFSQPDQEDDLRDHVTGIRQLAERDPCMDLERVGITSMESATNVVYAPLKHSDFYKVTVSHARMDMRFIPFLYEMYSGIVNVESRSAFGGPEDYVESFHGKLLLIYSLQTSTEASVRLADALQAAHKVFDTLCLPNMAAEVTSYTRCRGWDYLVRHLLGAEPPEGFPLSGGFEHLGALIGREAGSLDAFTEK